MATKFLGNIGDFFEKITGHNTPNFENFRKFLLKNAIKHTLWGDTKLQKFSGVPRKFTSDIFCEMLKIRKVTQTRVIPSIRVLAYILRTASQYKNLEHQIV